MHRTDLPSLEEIFAIPIRTVKYVPKGVRSLWAQCLARSAAQVVQHNDEHFWRELAMLAKCISGSLSHQGKSKKTSGEALIRTRAQRWLNGERLELWEEVSQGRRPKGASPSLKNDFHLDRCLELARDGQYSKACQALTSSGIASSTRQNIAIMRSKHPTHEGSIDLSSAERVSNSMLPEISSELVDKMIRSFRRGTVPGRTSLRVNSLGCPAEFSWR